MTQSDDGSPWGEYRAAAAFTFDLDADESWRVRAEKDPAWGKRAIRTRGEFGPKVAVPRILEVFDRYDASCTFFVPGKVAEDWPGTVQAIHEAGHEIAHHGYTHASPRDMTNEEETAEFTRALDVFDDVLGETPDGYRNPGGGMSEHTLDLLVDHDMTYDSSIKDLDIPYGLPETDDRIVELPNSYYLDDFVYFGYNMGPTYEFQAGISPTGPVFDSWRREFDGIYKHNRLFMLTMHPQVIGRAGRMDALEELLQHVLQTGDTWVTTSREIAEHWQGRD